MAGFDAKYNKILPYWPFLLKRSILFKYSIFDFYVANARMIYEYLNHNEYLYAIAFHISS